MPKRGESQSEQHEKFVALARELGCDESEQNFDEKMKKLLAVKLPEEKNKKDES